MLCEWCLTRQLQTKVHILTSFCMVLFFVYLYFYIFLLFFFFLSNYAMPYVPGWFANIFVQWITRFLSVHSFHQCDRLEKNVKISRSQDWKIYYIHCRIIILLNWFNISYFFAFYIGYYNTYVNMFF